MPSGIPYILNASGERVYRAQVGDVLTGTIGTLTDSNGITEGTVRVKWFRGRSTFLQQSALGNAGITDSYTVTASDVGKELYIRYTYTDGNTDAQNPNSGAVVAVGATTDALPTPNFARQKQVTIPASGDTGRVWNFADDGDYLYAAANNDCCYVFDISNPASPQYVRTLTLYDAGGLTSDIPVTDVKIIEGNLYLCGRRIDWAADNEPGIIACYDLVDGSDPQWRSSYQPPNMGGGSDPGDRPVVPSQSGYGNDWYQGMSYNPNQPGVLNVASQFNGHTAIDISDPDNITRLANYGRDEWEANHPDWVAAGGKWETSNCASFTDVNGVDWVLYANHGFGMVAVNVSTAATPTDLQWFKSPSFYFLNGTDDVVDGGRQPYRIRMIHMVGNYAVTCQNTSAQVGSESIDRPGRGYIALDMTDPYLTPDEDDTFDEYIWCPIGIEDNDTWNNQGDQPIMGWDPDPGGLYGYWANGQRGTSVFDMSNPAEPKYLGLVGENMDAQTNIYQSYAVLRDGRRYQYYADAYDASPQKHYLYVDEVRNMAFTIGLEDTTSTTSQSINGSAFTCDARLASGLVHQASSGDTVTEVGVRVEQKAAARTYRIAIYEYNNSTEVPTGSPIYESGDLTAGSNDGVEENLTVTGLDVSLTSGTWYIVSVGEVAGQLGAVVYADATGFYGKREDSIGAAMPDPWAGGGSDSRAIAVYAKGISNVGILTTDKCSGLVVGKS